jgi:phosphoserine phosphatase
MRTAAFFRVEGTILSRGVLAASAYLAANGQGLRERIIRLGGIALAAPIYGLLGQNDRTMANRAAFLAFRRMSEDRVTALGREYFDDVLKGKLLQSGLDLLKKAKQDGHITVLLSESIEEIVGPLRDELSDVDYLVTNHIEFRDNECTGRLLDPIIGGHETRRWVTRFAEDNGIDLAGSIAYAAHGPDLLLLAAVGQPCAVNPDFTLRRAAEEAEWPVMDYRV